MSENNLDVNSEMTPTTELRFISRFCYTENDIFVGEVIKQILQQKWTDSLSAEWRDVPSHEDERESVLADTQATAETYEREHAASVLREYAKNQDAYTHKCVRCLVMYTPVGKNEDCPYCGCTDAPMRRRKTS